MQVLDLATWPRRQHFDFFRRFDEPFFGVTVRVDCTAAAARCRDLGDSFFLFYLHKCLVAVNAVEEFRYRIDGERVVVYDRVGASATIGRSDGTFDFSNIPFLEDFSEFVKGAQEEIARIQFTTGLDTTMTMPDVIHFSAAPWLDFTSLSHARGFGSADSCPKISVGKVTEREGRMSMPVSIHGHHGLMDGLHVGKFVEAFQGALSG